MLDTFNRANGAPGANWGGATSSFQIASNQLDVVSAGDTGPLLWSPTSFGATQQACVKLAAIDGNADDIALVLKAQSNTGLGNGLMEVLCVSAGARPVAVRSIAAGGATSVQYLHPDHLGSIGQITDANRNWVQDVYFKPYGGVRWSQSGILGPDSDSGTRRSYTGQYEETSQWLGSLMHYKARYYSPFLHRFTQPDTIVPNPGNPQSLNRFSYVEGDPIGHNDPTGHGGPIVCAIYPLGTGACGAALVFLGLAFITLAIVQLVAEAPTPPVEAVPIEEAPARDTTVLVPVQPAPRATEVKIGRDVAETTDTPEPEYIWRGTERTPKKGDFQPRLGEDDKGFSFNEYPHIAGANSNRPWVTAYSVSDLRDNGWVVEFDGTPEDPGHVSVRLKDEEKWRAWLTTKTGDWSYFKDSKNIKQQIPNTFSP